MIAAKDLRIGNLVYSNNWEPHYPEEIIKIYAIDQKYVQDSDRKTFTDISGIPLTEEWLVKCGFDTSQAWPILLLPSEPGVTLSINYSNGFIIIEQLTKDATKFSEAVEMYHSDDGKDLDWQSFPDQPGSIVPYCEVTYVHQLQNLYFALTGHELIITI